MRDDRGQAHNAKGKHVRPAILPAAVLGAVLLLVGCTPAPGPGPSTSSATPTESVSAGPESPGPAPSADRPSAAAIAGTPQPVATGLEAPWSVVFRDGVPLVSERNSSRILELATDGSSRSIGTVNGVAARGEAGLLGLAVGSTGDLFVYSTADGGNRVQRYPVTGTRGSLSLGQPRTLLDGIPAAGNHDGGRIAFGPDGMLYVTTGDAGRRDDAQDRDALAGKILRMTPDGTAPAGNPFPGSLVYSYGHRNPQGIAWADDGTMFATEFGQNTWDELNIITAGANYGWPTVEGIAERDGFVDPVQQWQPGSASPSGMAHSGGSLFIANLRGQVLRSVPVSDPSTSTEHFGQEFGRLRDVTVAPDGQLWFVTNNTDGRGSPRQGDDRILAVPLSRD
ncbi:glucose sorbosone dehydrogenase [Pseudarthrobacter chlorophenolicus A6]|uniref:Glucose sorbosone dehydrogenase n=1 Tax=Pseudarthrobacter chlorophenolicus (strain ATCC 700700 / DSM 12829 / CIP 107037 / JCM 12360 / KCTC 9906 / NCIMB 13794 / A6) TaxID=452863 RepID=B8HGH3_PSECP|nr:glucose sorbosone dehydrogenase [Pseudarthrobacter chlorophenolicus A6]SDQ67802.1 Glucose/arabinose dehydrogenase, beta-propeller fold [Pseudarthrobacter chlorophenolicus]